MAKLFPDKKVELPFDREMAAEMAKAPLKPLTVGELIAHLQTLDQSLPVVYPQFSEHMIMTVDDVQEKVMMAYRPDGWVHYHRVYNNQDNGPTLNYVIIG